MDATSIRFRDTAHGCLRGVDWSAAWTWLLCCGLVVYLGLKGGGYDPLVHDQAGIVVWWVVLAGALVGAFPRERLGRLALASLVLLALFVGWTALSLSWTESVERTSADLARVATYFGIFALALLSRRAGRPRQLIGAVATGIVAVSIVALFSRLHPAWFPHADQTARFLTGGRERLSYPLNYWNALAALIAIGLPLLLQLAADARAALVRAAAAAAMPALILAIFFTLSRAGIVATAVATAFFLAIAPDRLPKLLSLLVAGVGGALLILAASSRDALRNGLEGAIAHHQGTEVLLMTVAVCVVVGLLQLAISASMSGRRRPGWTVVGRERLLVVAASAVAVVAIAAVALGLPGRAADGWQEFKQGGQPGEGAGRLGSAAGESRYQFWSAAVRENATDPLKGTGSGTFEYWWTRDGDVQEIVHDTHSLYLQTLGELGIVGLALLAGFLLTVLLGGGRFALRGSNGDRSPLAAALAGCVAFCFTATFDWMWQVPVLPAIVLLLASVLVTARPPGVAWVERERGVWRVFACVAALAAIVAIAIPLASTTLVRQSAADFRAGELEAALHAARSAQSAEPAAASPRLQQALVLEAQGELGEAAQAARGATEKEETNWRNWLVLSRIEAERGEPAAAVAAYRRARSLNPRSPLFER